MSSPPGSHATPRWPDTQAATRPPDSAFSQSTLDDSRWLDSSLAPERARQRARRSSTRTRKLVLLALTGAMLLVLWLRLLTTQAQVDVSFHAAADGQSALLVATEHPQLKPAIGHTLRGVRLDDGRLLPLDLLALEASPRWLADDAQRRQIAATQQQLAALVDQPTLTLVFDGLPPLTVTPRSRGLSGIGLSCALLGMLALALYVSAAVLLLGRPVQSTLVYALMALLESGHLLLIGTQTLPGLGGTPALARLQLPLGLLADGLAAAALLHALALYPQRLARWRNLVLAAWLVGPTASVALLLAQPAGLWWWAQLLLLLHAAAACAMLRWVVRRSHGPMPGMLLRFCAAGLLTLLLLSAAVAWAGPQQQRLIIRVGLAWHVFFAALLMLTPFLSRARRLLREFAMLAGIATITASVYMLALTLLGLSHTAALALALALGLLAYLSTRHWLTRQLAGSSSLSAERMFDSLYRAARVLEQQPDQAGEQLGALLREVFDPLELARSRRPASRLRVSADGSTLVVPVPRLDGEEGRGSGTLVLRYGRRGHHLFNDDDLQLCQRLTEQLRRAVAYDRAVEQGRHEERLRIAQDLHDDIGARLLTLMYKAPDPEIESYIRHTLQDLKTLTRGLAASSHRLTHAAAEWKADIAQRLNATGCDLRWSFSCDRDQQLSIVQWSGLTRVLRELVNNIIAHAQASSVEVILQVEQGRLQLQVSDDGQGRAPEGWSHGLGLGGVRKRVKLLGGQVSWRERPEGGIRCEVQARLGA